MRSVDSVTSIIREVAVTTTPAPQDSSLLNNSPLHDNAARANKSVVFHNDGTCLHGLQYPPNTHASGEVDVAANLSATAHGGPGVHHGASTHPGPNINIARHDDGPLFHMSPPAHQGVRHHPHPLFAHPIGAGGFCRKTAGLQPE